MIGFLFTMVQKKLSGPLTYILQARREGEFKGVRSNPLLASKSFYMHHLTVYILSALLFEIGSVASMLLRIPAVSFTKDQRGTRT